MSQLDLPYTVTATAATALTPNGTGPVKLARLINLDARIQGQTNGKQTLSVHTTLFALLAHKITLTQQTVIPIRRTNDAQETKAKQKQHNSNTTDECVQVALLKPGTEEMRSFQQIVSEGIQPAAAASAASSSSVASNANEQQPQLQIHTVATAATSFDSVLASIHPSTDVTLLLAPSSSPTRACIAYNSARFTAEVAEAFTKRLLNIVDTLFPQVLTSKDGSKPIDLSLDEFHTLGLLQSEIEFIRGNNVNSLHCFGPAKSIPDTVLERALENPLATGMLYLEETWTRLRIFLHALHLAEAVQAHLSSIGKPDLLSRDRVTERAHKDGRRVPIIAQCVDRSPRQTIGMLAIQLCGSAYVPLNTADPSDRLGFLLGDLAVHVCLTQSEVQARLEKETQVTKNTVILSHDSPFLLAAAKKAELVYARMEGSLKNKGGDPGAEDATALDALRSEVKSLYHGIYKSRMGLEPLQPEDVCFLLYTSGSTGTPKCLQLTHTGFGNSMAGYQHHGFLLNHGMDPGKREQGTRLLQTAACSFDLHSSEIYGPMMAGSISVLLPHGGNTDMDTFSATIERHAVTAIQLVPSLLLVLLEFVDGFDCPSRLQSLRQIICAGERMPPTIVQRVRETLPGVKVMVNKMGPAESTIDAMWHRVDLLQSGVYEAAVPVGKPLPNYSAYIVDPRAPRVILPVGSIGELLLGGPGIMRGYANRDDLTQAALLKDFEEEISFRDQAVSSGKTHPQAAIKIHDAVVYRTGDLACFKVSSAKHSYTPSTLEAVHMGRADFQVKLRGQRLEVGEIESNVMATPLKAQNGNVIRLANACIVKREQGEQQFLASYLQLDDESKKLRAVLEGFGAAGMFDASISQQLQQACASKMAGYMVPKLWVVLKELPKNANGKVDRKVLMSLPLPEEPSTGASAATSSSSTSSGSPGGSSDATSRTLLSSPSFLTSPGLNPEPLPSPGAPPQRSMNAALVKQLEGLVAQAWTSTFSLPAGKMNAQSDFFAVGGSSLSAVTVLAKLSRSLREEFGGLVLTGANKLKMHACFEAPKLGDFASKLAVRVESQKSESDAVGSGAMIPSALSLNPSALPSSSSSANINNASDSVFPSSIPKRLQPPRALDVGSFAQQRVFLDERIRSGGGDTSLYTCTVTLTVHGGGVDERRLENALDKLMDRHSALRTSLLFNGSSGLQQRVHSSGESPFRGRDILRAVSTPKDWISLEQTLKHALNQPFTLLSAEVDSDEEASRAPKPKEALWRVFQYDLGKLTKQEFPHNGHTWLRAEVAEKKSRPSHLILFCFHHAVFDGVSGDIVLEELLHFYRGEASPLPELSIEYIDYSVLESAAIKSSAATTTRVQTAQLFWKDYLKGALACEVDLLSPSDKTRLAKLESAGGSGRTTKGATFRSSLDDSTLVQSMRAFQAKEACSPFVLFVALYHVFLYRYSYKWDQSTDICLGGITANRYEQELEGMIGFFANTFPMRSTIDLNGSFTDLLRSVKKSTQNVMENNFYPFDGLVTLAKKSAPAGFELPQGKLPFFQAFLAMADETVAGRVYSVDSTGQATWHTHNIDDLAGVAKMDLALNVGFIKDAQTGQEQVSLVWDYSVDLFSQQSIQSLSRRFGYMLQGFFGGSDGSALSKPLRQTLSLASPRELELLHRMASSTEEEENEPNPDGPTFLGSSSNGGYQIPSLQELSQLTIPEVIFQRARDPRCADKIALTLDEESLTYRQFVARVLVLVEFLRETHNVIPGSLTLIAQYVDRSIECVVGLVAIMTLGCIYVPLDVSLPADRLRAMLIDTRARVLLTNRAQAAQAERVLEGMDSAPIFVLHESAPPPAKHPEVKLPHRLRHTDVAYIIFTSGSTGRAKAIQLTHANFLNISIMGFQAALPTPRGNGVHAPIFITDDRVLATASCAFDAHIQESVGVLCAGATCVLLRPGGHLDAAYLLEDVVAKKQITMLSCVPSLLQALLQHISDMHATQPKLVHCLRSLRMITVGGEAVKPALVGRVLEATRLSKGEAGHSAGPAHFVNLYGPAECSDCACYHHCTPHDATLTTYSVPIGRSFPGYALHVLNESLLPVLPEAGRSGQLFVGGKGVMAGYFQNPALTDGVVSAYLGQEHGLLYRSGDLVEWTSDGELSFVGRADFQVKIRGQRLEVGEIEALMLGQSGVKDSRPWQEDLAEVIVVKREERGQEVLVAFVEMKPGPWRRLEGETGMPALILPGNLPVAAPSSQVVKNLAKSMKELCSANLPAFMVPASFLLLKHLPHNASDKVDRKALMIVPLASVQANASASSSAPASASLAAPYPNRPDSALGSSGSISSPPAASSPTPSAVLSSTPQPDSMSSLSSEPSDLQVKLLKIWAQVLSLPLGEITIDSAFVELGGTSLQAMQVISRIRATILPSISIATLFASPTIRMLSEKIKASLAPAPAADVSSPAPSSTPGPGGQQSSSSPLPSSFQGTFIPPTIASGNTLGRVLGGAPQAQVQQPSQGNTILNLDAPQYHSLPISLLPQVGANGLKVTQLPTLDINIYPDSDEEAFNFEEEDPDSQDEEDDGDGLEGEEREVKDEDDSDDSSEERKSTPRRKPSLLGSLGSSSHSLRESLLSGDSGMSTPRTPAPRFTNSKPANKSTINKDDGLELHITRFSTSRSAQWSCFQRIYSSTPGRLLLEGLGIIFQVCLFTLSIGAPYVILLLLEDGIFAPWMDQDKPTWWDLYLQYNFEIIFILCGMAVVRLFSFIVVKWLLLGRVKEGHYSLHSWYAYRFWLVRTLWTTNGILWPWMEGQALYCYFLRWLGVKVGDNCVLTSTSFEGFDLLELGDNVYVGPGVIFQHAQYFANADPRRAHFTLRKIQIGDECSIMEKSVIAAGINRIHIGRRVHCHPYSTVGDSVPDRAEFQTRGYTVPPLPPSGRVERFGGGHRSTIQSFVQFLIVMIVVVVYTQPVSVMTMVWFKILGPYSAISGWTYYALLPIWWNVWGVLTCFFVCLPGLRLFVGTFRVTPGTYPMHSWTYLRNVWLRDLMLTFNEDAFGIFGYTPLQKYFLRFLGAKVGARVEVADSLECVRIPFHMLRLDDGAFTTGGVSIGCYRIINGRWILEDGLVHFQRDSFLGNRSCVAHPCKLRPQSLVGACSYLSPFSIVKRSNVAFGIPAESLPINYQDAEPASSKKKKQLPKAGLCMRMTCLMLGHLLGDIMLGAAILLPLVPCIFYIPSAWWTDRNVLLSIPLLYIVFMINLGLLTTMVKWLLLGRETVAEHPFGGSQFHRVTMTQLVIDRFDEWAGPYLSGTEWANVICRMQGAKIGKNVWCHDGVMNLTNLDMLTIGDGCILSSDALLQPHTFEKRLLKLDRITLGQGVYIGVYSIVLPGAVIEDGAVVGDWTLIMRQEHIQADSEWTGNPAAFVRDLHHRIRPKSKRRKSVTRAGVVKGSNKQLN